MRKAIYAGGILAVLVAVVLIGQTRAAAQNQNRLAIQGDLLSLVGPGSSIGITVRDSESGVVVQSVRTDTPAARAGVKEGDIVTEFDGERARSAAQFSRLVRETAPGRTVKMTVLRNGAATTMDISPENRGADGIRFPDLTRDFPRRFDTPPRDFNFNFDFPDNGFPFSSSRRLGVTVTPLGDQLAAYFGVKQGVLVTEVAMGSVAEAAGIKAGDVITTVRGRTVSSSSDVVRELGEAGSGASVEIRVTRNHTDITLTAKMPERTRAAARPGARAI